MRHLTLKTNAHAHTYTHANHLSWVKVDCGGGRKVEGHFKWRCTGADLAPGMRVEGGGGERKQPK